MLRKLINVRSDGAKREYVMYTLKKGRGQVVNLFLEPPEEQGRVILRVKDNMWLRIPDVGQALRVSSMHSVVGGIFNNWDLMMSDFSSEYAVLKAEEDEDEEAAAAPAEARIVEPGYQEDGMIEIVSGLAGGETIAADGASFLSDGATVKVSE